MNILKVIGRTLAILTAAMVIVGIALAVGSIGSAAAGPAAANAMEQGHEMARGASLAGLGTVALNLGVVALITAVVSPIKQHLVRKRKAATPAWAA